MAEIFKYEELNNLSVYHGVYSGYKIALADGVTATDIVEIIIPDNYCGKPIIQINSNFSSCSNLKKLTIGKNVKFIENNAFDGCLYLKELYYNAEYASVDQADDIKRTPFTKCGKNNTGNGYTLTIGKDVRTIPRYMFKSFAYGTTNAVPTHIKEIKFENGVRTIEEEAFLGCLKGKTAFLPPSLEKEKVDTNAFESSTVLKYWENRGVAIPSTASGDMDFLAFSFNGLHSWDEFNIYRVSDGDRYNMELSPQSQDKTAENPGGDGMYYFGTNHKSKVFNINFAFDGLTDSKLRKLKQWLSGKDVGDLWFEEEPYKVYSAKVTGQPSVKVIPFDKYDDNGDVVGRVYKGEGSVQFTAYWPYAHTPETVWPLGGEAKDGKSLSAYADFYNKEQWAATSGLISTTETCKGENPGDLPAPFILKAPETINAETSAEITFKVGELEIKIPAETATKQDDGTFKYTHYTSIEWDSKTGIVSAEVDDSRTPIPYTGTSIGGIPVGGTTTLTPDGVTLNYHYWYY